MRRRLPLALGTVMIAVGLLGATLTFTATGASANDATPTAAHQQMETAMDQMMGAGTSAQMHANMPNGEAMMNACAAAGNGNGMMNGMMNGGPGNDNMMNGTPEATDGTPTP